MNWHTIWDFIKEWYWIPMLLIYAFIIITILGENRSPSKSLAYILVLIFLSVIGLLVYYFVGVTLSLRLQQAALTHLCRT